MPVHRGASKSLLGEVKEATYFHGADGMGGKPDPSPPSLDLVHPKPAPMAMVDIVTKYPGKMKSLQNTDFKKLYRHSRVIVTRKNFF